MSETWSASPEKRDGRLRRRSSTRTSPPAATPPAAIAAAGRTQLRGSRSERSSDSSSSFAQAESSSAAASVTALRVSSSRPESFSGGSIGRSAERSRLSTSPGDSAAIDAHLFLQLLDRPVDQHLGRPVRAAERAGDLPVVHAEREPHDQGVAAVVGKSLQMIHHALQLLPPLDDPLRAVRRGDRLGLLQDALRAASAVAVVVRGEVVGDADEPGAERAPVRLAPGSLEVPIRLEERLLGDVLGVVMVTDAVVRVRVDVAQMVAIELLEGAIELCFRLPRLAVVSGDLLLLIGHRASVLPVMPPSSPARPV